MTIRKTILAGLFAFTMLPVTAPRGESAPRVIEIQAKKFSFTPDHLTLKKGETVTLRLISTDRTHGFFQRALNVDTDVEAGKTTEVTVTPDKAGMYPVICDHYCGWGHGGMAMTIVVQ